MVMMEQRKQVSSDIYGCDNCKKEIKDFPNESQRLELTIFGHDLNSANLHFCSWDCVLKYIPKIKSDYFVSLPHLYFDEPKGSKRGIVELVKLLKKLNGKK